MKEGSNRFAALSETLACARFGCLRVQRPRNTLSPFGPGSGRFLFLQIGLSSFYCAQIHADQGRSHHLKSGGDEMCSVIPVVFQLTLV